MELFNIRWATALSAVILAFNAYAGDEDSKKAVVPMEQPAVSRWSVSTGATVSSIKSSFRFAPPELNALSAAAGSTAIYDGVGVLVYQNGTVGPAIAPGVADFTGDARIIPTVSTFNGATGVPGSASDTATSVGPYVKLGYDVADFASNTMHLSAFGQYTFTTAFNSGSDPLFVTNVTTSYLSIGSTLFFTPGGGFPNQVFSPGQTAFVASGVNIDMHTFTLGFDLTKDITDRVHLVFSTGPTLNLFYTGLTSTPVFLPTGTVPARSDDSTFRFGWVGQLGVQIDLDAQKRWFLEASGNYHWVTPFTVSTPLSSAKIQASSWGGELGAGLRF